MIRSDLEQHRYLTCKEAASLLRVSVSTVKRLCDNRDLEFIRTPGGHRRVLKQEVVRLQQERQSPLLQDSLDVESDREWNDAMDGSCEAQLYEHLIHGELELVKSIIERNVRPPESLARLFDEQLAPAMHRIGQLWEAKELDVYQEHIGSQTLDRALTLVQSLISSNQKDRPAQMRGSVLIACVGMEQHSMASKMIELACMQLGFQPRLLGPMVPFQSLLKAVRSENPQFIILSYTLIDDESQAVSENHELFLSLTAGQRLLIGGQGLSQSIRPKLRFHFYGDTITQLMDFLQPS